MDLQPYWLMQEVYNTNAINLLIQRFPGITRADPFLQTTDYGATACVVIVPRTDIHEMEEFLYSPEMEALKTNRHLLEW